jgi:hypothetical protein
VSETVTVDAHDLFSQLTALAYLGKREPVRNHLCSTHSVTEGTIRVWRDWLSRQCESKKWTDGEPVVIHHDLPSSSPSSGKGKARSDSVTGRMDPTKDPSVLWINTRDQSVGIKFRVKERKWRRANPILYESDVEVAVCYIVEFEGEYQYRFSCCHTRLQLMRQQRSMSEPRTSFSDWKKRSSSS